MQATRKIEANAPIAKTLRPIREGSVDFETTKNLFIEGDNLDALKLLQESYLGKVKLIYIDPPFRRLSVCYGSVCCCGATGKRSRLAAGLRQTA